MVMGCLFNAMSSPVKMALINECIFWQVTNYNSLNGEGYYLSMFYDYHSLKLVISVRQGHASCKNTLFSKKSYLITVIFYGVSRISTMGRPPYYYHI